MNHGERATDKVPLYDVDTNGISLHVTEQGAGSAVRFCHGFPDTSYTWRRQMKAVASAGYRAIAPWVLYWASGSAPADTRWSPRDPARSLHRSAPGPLPSWAESDYVRHNVAEFQRTGFHGSLNYYRAAELYFHLSGAFKGAQIAQPSFFIWGKADGLKELYPLTIDQMRVGLPGLMGGLELDDMGHWVQHEATDVVSNQLVKFLRVVDPV